jgi:hypothetical protein
MADLTISDPVSSAISAASSLIQDGINKIWPDPTAKATAEAQIMKAASDASLAQMQQAMSVMLAEANSTDKWTSRARPSFLYVMYLLMLASIPFACLWAFSPVIGANMATGMKYWLAAIPDNMWTTFEFIGGGYMVGRSIEKVKGVSK